MVLQNKYDEVLKLGEKLNVKDGYVKEEEGKLKIGGVTETQYDKDKMWDKIKEIGGENPVDLEADIKVSHSEFYHKHVVEKGESLSIIAKHYFKDPMLYNQIFEANRDQLNDPNMIHPGQELIIPFPK